MTLLTDLPQDIILLILPLLDPGDFLTLSSITKAFNSSFRLESTYWRNQLTTTFRIPISPLLITEGGAHWYWLYKKLRTQTFTYTWGEDKDGCLGLDGHFPVRIVPPQPEVDEHGIRRPVPVNLLRHHRLPATTTPHTFPEEMHIPSGVGIIADLQCGGWSTSILTSKGDVWSVGILDAANGNRYGQPTQVLEKLTWGENTLDGSLRKPIKQFSSGRCHILGLDDAGNVWTWNQIYKPARHIEFLSPDLVDSKKPTRVVAGWGTSSAFVPERGIVYWSPPNRDHEDFEVNENIIPKTGFFNIDSDSNKDNDTNTDEARSVGEVLGHIVLESYIVFITSTSKVFAFQLGAQAQPFEVTSLSSTESTLLDIQGSFRNFAVFSSSGEVRTCTVQYLDSWFNALTSLQDPDLLTTSDHLLPPPPMYPALQNTSVISLAFGDYHIHALHSTGHISSYGFEPSSCGCFGLGSSERNLARLRGLIPPLARAWRGETRLSSQGWRSPRRIWFDEDLQNWGRELADRAAEKGWLKPEQEGGLDEEQWAGVSEWIEQEGLTWSNNNKKSSSESNQAQSQNVLTTDEDPTSNLPPHFALAISAAGWHSGALVLVDRNLKDSDDPSEVRSSRARTIFSGTQKQQHQDQNPTVKLPTLQLPSGKMVQGDDSEPTAWKLGMPDRLWTSVDGEEFILG